MKKHAPAACSEREAYAAARDGLARALAAGVAPAHAALTTITRAYAVLALIIIGVIVIALMNPAPVALPATQPTVVLSEGR